MIKVKDSEFTFTFSKSSGSGGQNVNKLNTCVTLSWDMDASKALNEEVKERFRKSYKRFVSDDGTVSVTSQRHRSQKRNIEDCKEKLMSMLNSVRLAPKPRKATRPTRSSIRKRLDGKKRHSEKKKRRKDPEI